MNDNILRGFCQKCEWPIIAIQVNKDWFPSHWKDDEYGHLHDPSPVWFLSSQQMKILFKSTLIIHPEKKSELFIFMHNKKLRYDFFKSITIALEEQPFLVAKILRENEKND